MKWDFWTTDSFPVEIPGRVDDDPMYPRTSLRAVKANMIDGLEDLDPADLKHFFGQAIVAGDPLGEGKEAPGTAGHPSFAVAFKQGTVFGGPFEFRGGKNVKITRHPFPPCNCCH